MARSMTGSAVGRVNTRFLLLAFILAGLSAVLAYVALSGSGGESSSGAGISVVVATSDIESGTTIEASMLTLKEFPAGDVPAGVLNDIELAVGKTVFQEVPAQDWVFSSAFAGFEGRTDSLPFIIPPGMRGMAITTTTLVGAGGLILPGDHVDIMFVPASSEDQLDADQVGALLIAENIEVLAVQKTLVDVPSTVSDDPARETVEGERVRGTTGETDIEATTLTLLVTQEQAEVIFCAESLGSLRLSVRQFGDDATTGTTSGCILRGEEEVAP